jgi:hypothetical protein
MRLNGIWIGLSILILMSGCISRPKLNPYVPKENVKTSHVSTSDIASPPKNISRHDLDINHTSYLNPEKSTTPTILITDVILEPDPVPVNQAFDFHVKFKAAIPGLKRDKIVTTFYFKILKKNKVLFKSEPYSIKVTNNKIKTWTQHMNPVAAKGEYTLEVLINHKNIQAEKRISLTIE